MQNNRLTEWLSNTDQTVAVECSYPFVFHLTRLLFYEDGIKRFLRDDREMITNRSLPSVLKHRLLCYDRFRLWPSLYSCHLKNSLVCLRPAESQRILSSDVSAMWQIPFNFYTSVSSSVTNHLMRSEDGNLVFIINKSLCRETCLLFASALKTITVSLHFGSDCTAYFMATVRWWWNWKPDLLFTVNKRNWKSFYTHLTPPHLSSKLGV